jgi:hypothetical protein
MDIWENKKRRVERSEIRESEIRVPFYVRYPTLFFWALTIPTHIAATNKLNSPIVKAGGKTGTAPLPPIHQRPPFLSS